MNKGRGSPLRRGISEYEKKLGKKGKDSGWHGEPHRHSLASRGIKTGRKMKASGNAWSTGDVKVIYQNDELVKFTQDLFEKKMGHKLTSSKAKWMLANLFKHYKEDYIKDELETEVYYARDEYKDEKREARSEAKIMEMEFEFPPFKEWFAETRGYLPTMKEYLINNEDDVGIALYDEVKDVDFDDYFDIFTETVKGKKYVYIEKIID